MRSRVKVLRTNTLLYLTFFLKIVQIFENLLTFSQQVTVIFPKFISKNFRTFTFFKLKNFFFFFLKTLSPGKLISE